MSFLGAPPVGPRVLDFAPVKPHYPDVLFARFGMKNCLCVVVALLLAGDLQ